MVYYKGFLGQMYYLQNNFVDLSKRNNAIGGLEIGSRGGAQPSRMLILFGISRSRFLFEESV